jgi:hypothetical protein
MSSKRCIAIKALWREDHPEGFGIEFLGYSEGSLDLAVEKIDELVIQIAETDHEKDPHMIIEYFTWVGKNKEFLGAVERMQALTMVAYAEEQGLMQSDEYNGMVYVYEQDGMLIVDRKDR